jgi:hypothetical protein
MLSLTTMRAMATLPAMKATKNRIRLSVTARGGPEAANIPAYAPGFKFIIPGRRHQVLDQETEADAGAARLTRDERRSSCASL